MVKGLQVDITIQDLKKKKITVKQIKSTVSHISFLKKGQI
jgi:hypothetical protein